MPIIILPWGNILRIQENTAVRHCPYFPYFHSIFNVICPSKSSKSPCWESANYNMRCLRKQPMGFLKIFELGKSYVLTSEIQFGAIVLNWLSFSTLMPWSIAVFKVDSGPVSKVVIFTGRQYTFVKSQGLLIILGASILCFAPFIATFNDLIDSIRPIAPSATRECYKKLFGISFFRYIVTGLTSIKTKRIFIGQDYLIQGKRKIFNYGGKSGQEYH